MTEPFHLVLAEEPRDPVWVKRSMQGRDMWGILLNIAQRHCLQPRSMFDMVDVTREARGDAWEAMLDAGASIAELAMWWNTSTSAVSRFVAGRMADRGGKSTAQDETTPRLIRGEGDRRDDCKAYMGCLGDAGKASFGQARCPRKCTGYQPIRLRATDYMDQKDAPDKYASSTGSARRSG